MQEKNTPDKFYAKIWNIGPDSKGITIPINLIRGLNLQTGDEITVWVKKKPEETQ